MSIFANEYREVQIDDCAAGDVGDPLTCVDCFAKVGEPHAGSCPVPRGHSRAFYFGTEAQCNSLLFGEYKDDVADGYGFDSWSDVPMNRRKQLRRMFDAGFGHEKSLPGYGS